MSDRRSRLEGLFLACLELPTEERAVFLQAACPHELELQAEVLALLAQDGKAWASGSARLREMGEQLPEDLPNYRLLERIGEGGFGTVYLAEQTAPVRRRVAVKILRLGLLSPAALTRFEAEGQILARMDHPAIARVYDAGRTDSGRPYLAMELVEGEPITAFVERHGLATGERLRLFVAVSRAVEHAHQKGVIHRDLKPSNLLVTEVDGRPMPKVIDFGIAELRASSGGEPTSPSFVGTPEYASPEHLASGGGDVDVRSDVYSLGRVLARLLEGLPHADRGLVREAGWVAARALAPDRRDRYDSASALAEDLERLRRHEPLVAAPPSRVYRSRKWLRRHRALALGTAAVGLALVGGITATSFQAERARRAEARARAEAEVAEQANAFLTWMLGSANPQSNPRGSEVTVRELLDLARADLPSRDFASLAAAAAIEQTLASAYLGLGLYPEADTLLTSALRRIDGAPDPGSVGSGRLPLRCDLLLEQARLEELRGDSAAADSVLAEIERLLPADDRIGANFTARFLQVRGAHLANLGRWDLADSLLGVAVAGCDPDEPRRAEMLMEQATIRARRGRIAEADSLGRQALVETRAAFGHGHHQVAMAAGRYAAIVGAAGRWDEAEELNREALRVHGDVLGPGHPLTAIARANLALVLETRGRPEDAEPEYRAALALLVPALGDEHREVVNVRNNYATSLQNLGRLDEALALRESVLAARRRAFGEVHPEVAIALNNLGSLHRLRRDWLAAESVFEEALSIYLATVGESHPNVAIGLHNLGRTRVDAGLHAEAERDLGRAIELGTAAFPPGHLNLAIFRATHGRALLGLGRVGEAEDELRGAHAAILGALGVAHARTRETATVLAELYRTTARPDSAAVWDRRAAGE